MNYPVFGPVYCMSSEHLRHNGRFDLAMLPGLDYTAADCGF